jgi:hypothetical protein
MKYLKWAQENSVQCARVGRVLRVPHDAAGYNFPAPQRKGLQMIKPYELEPMQMKRYLIEKVEIGLNTVVPRHFLMNAEISKYMDYMTDGLIFRFRSYLAGAKHESTHVEQTIKVPLSWWDHVKERFAPKWFLKRWPTQYRTIEVKRVVTITNICPHIEVPHDDRRHFEVLFAGKL